MGTCTGGGVITNHVCIELWSDLHMPVVASSGGANLSQALNGVDNESSRMPRARLRTKRASVFESEGLARIMAWSATLR